MTPSKKKGVWTKLEKMNETRVIVEHLFMYNALQIIII